MGATWDKRGLVFDGVQPLHLCLWSSKEQIVLIMLCRLHLYNREPN